MMVWAIFSLINLIAICRIVWLTRKELGFVNGKGVFTLTLFGLVAGPCFTALCLTYMLLERHE